MKSNLYTQFILTVIAALLAWNALLKTPATTVQAQSSARYRAVVFSVGASHDEATPKQMGERLTEAAKGGELVQVIGGYYTDGARSNLSTVFAIYKDR